MEDFSNALSFNGQSSGSDGEWNYSIRGSQTPSSSSSSSSSESSEVAINQRVGTVARLGGLFRGGIDRLGERMNRLVPGHQVAPMNNAADGGINEAGLGAIGMPVKLRGQIDRLVGQNIQDLPNSELKSRIKKCTALLNEVARQSPNAANVEGAIGGQVQALLHFAGTLEEAGRAKKDIKISQACDRLQDAMLHTQSPVVEADKAAIRAAGRMEQGDLNDALDALLLVNNPDGAFTEVNGEDNEGQPRQWKETLTQDGITPALCGERAVQLFNHENLVRLNASLRPEGDLDERRNEENRVEWRGGGQLEAFTGASQVMPRNDVGLSGHPMNLEDLILALTSFSYLTVRLGDLEGTLASLEAKIETWKDGGLDTPLNRDELWLLDHLASDKHYNCLNALCRNLREHFGVADGQIPPLLQSMQKLRVSGFLDAYVKHQFSEHRPGDVLLYDSGRNAAYAGKKLDTHDKQQQLLTGSSTSHVGVIGGRTEEGVAKRLDSYDNMIVYKDLDAGRSYYTSAWRLDVSKMVSPQLGQVLGAAGITDELLQNAYQNVCKQVARNENEQYWPNNARNDLDRRNRSVIPRLPKLGGSYERIANMQRPTMICSEFSMRYEVAVILQLQQNLREILVENPAAQQEAQDEGLDLANMPLFELPLPPNTKMKALHPGKVEKIFQNLLDSGAMSEVRKPPRHIPPPPQAPPPAAAAPPPAAVPPIQNPVQAAPVDEARSDVEDEQQEPYHPEVDDF